MHDPELLILDEPTVGVDPLLRQSIWNHLVQITKDGNKTVIITTHYIEEARQAHTVSDINCKLMGFRVEGPHLLVSHTMLLGKESATPGTVHPATQGDFPKT
jgi:ABC-type lipoprotein export system ATPase subunit